MKNFKKKKKNDRYNALEYKVSFTMITYIHRLNLHDE